MKNGLILHYGIDAQILALRGRVLESAGFLNQIATSLTEAERVAGIGAVELCVMCYSLTPGERRECLELLSQIQPEIKFLLMQAADSMPIPGRNIYFFEAITSPSLFVSTIRKIVDRATD